MTERRDAIASVLVYHHTQPGPKCSCGYRYRPGEFIPRHKADVIDAALTLMESGVPADVLHQAALAAVGIAGKR